MLYNITRSCIDPDYYILFWLIHTQISSWVRYPKKIYRTSAATFFSTDTDRGASRDLDGNILIWDLNKAIETNYDVKDYEKILVRRVHSNSRTVTCIAMDQRKLVMGSIGTFCVFDYWNTAL